MRTLRDLLHDFVVVNTGTGRLRRPLFWVLLVWSGSVLYLAHVFGEVTGRPTLTGLLGFLLFVGPWFWYFLRNREPRRTRPE